MVNTARPSRVSLTNTTVPITFHASFALLLFDFFEALMWLSKLHRWSFFPAYSSRRPAFSTSTPVTNASFFVEPPRLAHARELRPTQSLDLHFEHDQQLPPPDLAYSSVMKHCCYSQPSYRPVYELLYATHPYPRAFPIRILRHCDMTKTVAGAIVLFLPLPRLFRDAVSSGSNSCLTAHLCRFVSGIFRRRERGAKSSRE
jgi:hypothetical protein